MAREAGHRNVKTKFAKDATKDYFVRMLTDAAESETWARFLASEDENVALKAFLRAVEYKRGKPIQPTEVSGINGEPIQVITNAQFPPP